MSELNVLRILKRAGIRPLPVQQYRIRVEGRTYVLDYFWPATRTALEFDGAGGHNFESARHDDRDRTRRLQRAGITVWAITETTPEAEIVEIGRTATRIA